MSSSIPPAEPDDARAVAPVVGPATGDWPRWRVFPPIALGVIMATLDASVVNIALPTLQRTLRAPLSTVEWVALAYSLTLTGLLLTSGRLADARGRRAVYGNGLLLFTLASVLCGFAPSVGALIALRVLQGVGAALVSANGSALLVQAFPLAERGRALGAFGAMVGVGLAIGPPLGGLVVAHASWRWIFFVNLPLGLLAWNLLQKRVPPDQPNVDAVALDGIPPLLWAGGLAGVMLALTRAPEHGLGDPFVLVAGIGGALLLTVFFVLQANSPRPMLPLDLLFGPLGGAVTLTFLGQLLSVSVGFLMPLVLEETGGLTAAQSGSWLAILPVAALFCAPLAGRLADRVGPRSLTVTGMALTAVGLGLLSRLGVMPAGMSLVLGLMLIGIGLGLFAVPNASALLSLVPPERLGIATGLQGTTRSLGIATGIALTGALATLRYHTHAHAELHLGVPGGVDRMAFVLATRDTFFGLALLAVVAAWLAWRVRTPRAATAH